MTEPTEKTPSDPTPAELRFGGGWKILIPFAILPLIVVSISVGIFLLFGMLANSELGPQDYLTRLRSGSSHKKWQAAYELSRFLAQGKAGKDRAAFEKEMLETLKSTTLDEKELRKYLIIGLGQIGTRASVSALSQLVSNESDSEIKIYAIWALGRIGSPEVCDLIEQQTHSEDAGIRKTAAFTLGFVGNAAHIRRLQELLGDPINDVRWNASLALAQLGNSAGKTELLHLLDPDYLARETPNLREAERSQVMLSAVNAVGRLKLAEAKPALEKLSQEAPDPVLRTAIRNVLKII